MIVAKPSLTAMKLEMREGKTITDARKREVIGETAAGATKGNGDKYKEKIRFCVVMTLRPFFPLHILCNNLRCASAPRSPSAQASGLRGTLV